MRDPGTRAIQILQGISFIFEDAKGLWLITILGNSMRDTPISMPP
jgi:hypothetical protein